MGEPDSILVMKFGGTSVGDASAIQGVVEIVHQSRDAWPRLLVVTSALAGVTNQLLAAPESAVVGDELACQQIRERLYTRHIEILNELVPEPSSQIRIGEQIEVLLGELTSLCHAIAILGEASPRALDAIASLGERMSARVLAGALQASGLQSAFVDANRLIITDDTFQNAHPDFATTQVRSREALFPMLMDGTIPVVTGFLAANRAGVITTLGRGGSDYSAAILAAALPADEVWIWTDVDGVMTADPRLVPEARSIPVLSYHEVAELAYFGARVLHPKAIRPVIEAGIVLRILNTFNPTHPGTRVIPNASPQQDGAIKAVTAIQGQRLITVEGRGMIGVPGVAARAFAAVARTGTSVILITQASSEQSICFAVPSGTAEIVVAALEETFDQELARRDIDRIWTTDEAVIVTVVGAGMRHTPGVAGKIFSALGDRGVNIVAIAQGSSEAAISMVAAAQDAEAAVRALHELITRGD